MAGVGKSLRAAVVAAVMAVAMAAPASANAQSGSPLDGDGMWVWYVSQSGGSASAIAQQAKTYGLEHVLVKAGDGACPWSQFTPELVSTLHANGIRVCAWQFVYGRNPTGEADVGAAAAAKGADCLVIDAESHYEGRYSAADKYIRRLRSSVGASYPLALAGFPYVDFHPSFPYSVFLGRGAAQYNVPQMYWKTIGTSVRTVYEHTYRFNRAYKRRIFPLGQTYAGPSVSDITSFRSYALSHNATGVSWWSWQETSTSEWQALSQPIAAVSGYSAPDAYPKLHRGSRGDLVVFAQELLRAGGPKVKVTGVFSKKMKRAVRRFQRRAGVRPNAKIGIATWKKLLSREPASVRWSLRKKKKSKKASAASGESGPRSASLPALGYEIPPTSGSG
jgi:peptidoglycan hydrolase-like protein with peptidoglycan-binding domain